MFIIKNYNNIDVSIVTKKNNNNIYRCICYNIKKKNFNIILIYPL